MARKVQLAVVAHIRHQYTDYDKLLRRTTWGEARKQVEQPCLDQIVKWRGEGEEEVSELEDIFREVIVLDDDDDEEEEDGKHGTTTSGENAVDARESSVEVISCRLVTDVEELEAGIAQNRTEEPSVGEPSRSTNGRPARIPSPGLRQSHRLRFQEEARRRYNASLQALQTANGQSVFKSIEKPADVIPAQPRRHSMTLRKRKPSPEHVDRTVMLPQRPSKRSRPMPSHGVPEVIDLTMTSHDTYRIDQSIGAEHYDEVGRNMYQYPKLKTDVHHVREHMPPSAARVYDEDIQRQQYRPPQIRETMRNGIPVVYANLSRSQLIPEGQLLPTSRTWREADQVRALPVRQYRDEDRLPDEIRNGHGEGYYTRAMPGSYPVEDAHLRRTHDGQQYIRAAREYEAPLSRSLYPRPGDMEGRPPLWSGPGSTYSVETLGRDVGVYELPVRAARKYYSDPSEVSR